MQKRIEKTVEPLLADIFVPECGITGDKVLHQLFALGIIDHSDIHAAGFYIGFWPLEGSVFTDDDFWYAIK